MGLLSYLKTAFSPRRFFGATGRLLEGYGTNGEKPWPFNYWSAVNQFHGFAGAAAWKNATAFACVPLRLYTRRKSGGNKLYETRPTTKAAREYFDGLRSYRPSMSVMSKAAEFAGDLEEVTEPHPVLEVLKTVNPHANGYELQIQKALDLQITGNHYQHIITDPDLDIPSGIWRFDPRLTHVVPSKDGWVSGYSYGQTAGEAKFFPEDEIIHSKLPSISNYLYGQGWYERAWTAVGLDRSKRTSDKAKFDNFARPDWLLSVGNGQGGTNSAALNQLENKINEKMKGEDKHGRFLVGNGDIKATALQWDVPETGSAQRVIEEIAAISGVPVTMLLENDPTKATSQVAQLGWYRTTIHHYCSLDAEKLNERWVSRFPDAEEMFVAYDPVAFEDREAQQKRLVAFVAGGIMTPNEARIEEGYAPSTQPEANRLYPPTGSTAGAAAVAGNASVGQNDRRRNED